MQLLVIGIVIVFALPLTVAAQSSDQRIGRMDKLVARTRALTGKAGFDRRRLFGAALNLVALADRWTQVRGQVEEIIRAQGDEADPAAPSNTARSSGIKPISNVTLSLSRYSGFTQNGTSSAWCGSSIVVAFTDTGSEIKTLAANTGISMVGVSTSANRGGAFAYLGPPSPSADFSQMVAGDPLIACADPNTFYYSAVWADLLNNTAGVAFAKSTDGGRTFSAPVVVASKSASDHLVATDWLAIDPNHPQRLYIAYADIDFSGFVCGRDPIFHLPVTRYAIEMVSSSDSGATWSKLPTEIDQVCAGSASPNASLAGPRIAVAPDGKVYVAYEASGENGGGLTSRQINIAKSLDGGGSFSPPALVTLVTPVGNGADLQGFIRANEFPSLAIGRGSSNMGLIFLTWNDAGNIAPDMLSTTSVYGFADIKFTDSRDGGVTWSNPIRVNDNSEGNGAPLSDQFEPAIATDKTGRIGICFYDRRRDPNNFLIDRECASSSNNGASWSNKRITSSNFPSVVGQDIFVAPDYMGDYDTLATDATNQNAGFLNTYASQSVGNPNVTTSQF